VNTAVADGGWAVSPLKIRRDVRPATSVATTSNFIASGGSNGPGSAHHPCRLAPSANVGLSDFEPGGPFHRTYVADAAVAPAVVKFDVGADGWTDRDVAPPVASAVSWTSNDGASVSMSYSA